MPQPQQSGNGELPEFLVVGPFGGIQSELPLELISGIGFADALNILFRIGKARVRPQFISSTPTTGIPQTPRLVTVGNLVGRVADLQGEVKDLDTAVGQTKGIYEPWTGIFDFFTAGNVRIQVATTPTQVYYNAGGVWNRLFGAQNGTSTPLTPMSFAVVGQKLYMSQGVDGILVWDGTAAGPTPAYVNPNNDSLNAPAANYLFEFGNHLIALNTISQGAHTYQRVAWSGAGDGTDWTSFDSGQSDQDNDLGPINGGLKLFQYGYIFQQFGIVQMQLTGQGTAPFYFQPITSRSKGLAIPRSLAANGESSCYYVGQDNVYTFDGTTSTPVGDMPFQGRQRLGARSRIFQDIALADPSTIFGFVSITINGTPFNAYWLVIPNVAMWVYHIDDMTWTRWTVTASATAYPTCIGVYLANTVIRVCDLKGTVQQQQWTPATLTNNNPFPAVMIGFTDGTAKLFDFTGWSEESWYVETGEMEYDDPRHEDVTKKVRLTYKDNGNCLIQLQFTNENGDTSINAPTEPDGLTLPGTNSGKTQKIVLPVNLSGIFATMRISGEAGVPFEMTGYAPAYSPSGEVRNAL